MYGSSGDTEEVASLAIPVGVTDLSVASLVEDQVASASIAGWGGCDEDGNCM